MTAPVEHRVRVQPAGSPAYEVRVGPGVTPVFARELPDLLGSPPARLLAVADAGLPDAWLDRALAAYRDAGYDADTLAIEPSEKIKSLETLRVILEALAARRHERREPLLAVGGGVIGDLAGFAAATYRRGVPVIQCPTTLLAMVDASTGGKTGVNLAVGAGDTLKNMVGAFHQPRAVLADVDALASLPDRQLRAGLAECVKHGMIAADWDDPDLAVWMRDRALEIAARDPDALVELIARNVAVKARVVAADEREMSDTGGRALLNLGHTFAHAIETIPALHPADEPPPLLHGEAVALGLIAAAACAAETGRVDRAFLDRTRDDVAAFSLPTAIAGLPDDPALIERMRHDKKTTAGAVRLVLPTGPGRAELTADAPEPAIAAGWSAIRA